MTLHYKFPENITLDEVRAIVDAEENFILAEKDGYLVANYVRSGNDVFPPVTDRATAIRRELRGLVFSPEGEVISRRFHKFFNYGEREDVSVLDLSKSHVILEKLDGSMITPIYVNGKLEFGTKMGLTEVAEQASLFVEKVANQHYKLFVQACFSRNFTPIFEWCSRQQRIVIDYPEDKLVLLAIRVNSTGAYLSYETVVGLGRQYGIPVVDALEPMSNIDAFIAELKKREDIEGVVVQFDDGHMVKIKTDTYVTLHRAKSLLENEIETVQLILEDKVDDLYPLLPQHQKETLHSFVKCVWRDVENFHNAVNIILKMIEATGMSRKDFALSEIGKGKYKTAVFSNWDKSSFFFPEAVEYVLSHCSSNKQFDKIAGWLIKDRWKEFRID